MIAQQNEKLHTVDDAFKIEYFKQLHCKICVENALYSEFDGFPLIFGRLIQIRSPFLTIGFEFCTVASFAFFSVKIYIFELFSKFIIFKNLTLFNMGRE